MYGTQAEQKNVDTSDFLGDNTVINAIRNPGCQLPLI